MASIRELEDTIRACRERINLINHDIETMEAGKEYISTRHDQIEGVGEYIRPYDISDGEIWKGDLYDDACVLKESLDTGIEDAKTTCTTANDELTQCINAAKEEIIKLNGTIDSCNREIARLQEEARKAAERAARMAKYPKIKIS